jgi:hypothetical protein
MKRQSNSTTVTKLNPKWIKQVRQDFRKFLQMTHFPDPVRNGTRGSQFEYPEWLIMLIAVVSVKAKVTTYLGIHRLAVEYWSVLTPDPNLQPISETQLRERLKKIGHTPRSPAGFISQLFSPADLA